MYVLSPFRGVCVCESVGVVGAHVRVCVRVCHADDGRERTTVQRGSCLWNGIKTRAGSQLQETGLTVGKRGREAYTHAAAARVVFFFGGPYFCSCRVWRRATHATHATHATLAVHSCSLLLFTQPVHAPHTPLTCSDHLSPRGFSTIPSLRRLFRSSSTGPPLFLILRRSFPQIRQIAGTQFKNFVRENWDCDDKVREKRPVECVLRMLCERVMRVKVM